MKQGLRFVFVGPPNIWVLVKRKFYDIPFFIYFVSVHVMDRKNGACKMKLLIVDDEPYNLEAACRVLKESLDAEIVMAETVSQAIDVLLVLDFDLIITDVFIPMGADFKDYVGPRARKYQDDMQHLGGLALLDSIEKISNPPKILVHTACTDFALLQVFGEYVVGRIPKPAPIDVFLKEVRDALDSNDSWFL